MHTCFPFQTGEPAVSCLLEEDGTMIEAHTTPSFYGQEAAVKPRIVSQSALSKMTSLFLLLILLWIALMMLAGFLLLALGVIYRLRRWRYGEDVEGVRKEEGETEGVGGDTGEGREMVELEEKEREGRQEHIFAIGNTVTRRLKRKRKE